MRRAAPGTPARALAGRRAAGPARADRRVLVQRVRHSHVRPRRWKRSQRAPAIKLHRHMASAQVQTGVGSCAARSLHMCVAGSPTLHCGAQVCHVSRGRARPRSSCTPARDAAGRATAGRAASGRRGAPTARRASGSRRPRARRLKLLRIIGHDLIGAAEDAGHTTICQRCLEVIQASCC